MMDEGKERPEAGAAGQEAAAPSAESEPLSRLLKVAGRRPEAPPHVVAEIKRVAYPAWQEKVRAVAEARRRRFYSLAAAAVLLLTAGGVLWRLAPAAFDPTENAGARVARVEGLSGDVRVTGGSRSVALTTGSGIAAGRTIETGRGFATLRLNDGTSIRLDAGSSLRLASETTFELFSGGVYLDTGSGAKSRQLTVMTEYGVARDIGTQFEVRLLEDGLRVQVREGEVELDLEDATHRAGAGTALTVRSGAVAREDVLAHGSSWSWVLQTSPSFELEGKTLGLFLDWVARETGWQPRFADPDLERDVVGTVLHGPIIGVRPDQAPDQVLPTSGLRYRLEGGTMWIEQAGR